MTGPGRGLKVQTPKPFPFRRRYKRERLGPARSVRAKGTTEVPQGENGVRTQARRSRGALPPSHQSGVEKAKTHCELEGFAEVPGHGAIEDAEHLFRQQEVGLQHVAAASVVKETAVVQLHGFSARLVVQGHCRSRSEGKEGPWKRAGSGMMCLGCT